MRICVVGAGYVGLVTAAGFAELGHEVTCADIDDRRIAGLAEGIVPIWEEGLEPLVARHRASGRLAFTSDLGAAIGEAEIVICGVSTPAGEGGAADLGAVLAVAERVRNHARGEVAFVLKSTVPVGTHRRITRLVADATAPVHVVSNPEFLKEGTAVRDFLAPDRIILGLPPDDPWAERALERLYRPLEEAGVAVFRMDPASAELTKYVANAMLAMRVSFINEVAALCEQVGADIHDVREGVGSDGRIGAAFLYASCGYGGSCFPKDVQALVHTAAAHDIELSLARATHEVNERQKQVLFTKLLRAFDGDLAGRRVAVWGAAFKAGTDDVRDSPALALLDRLLEVGAIAVVHDPAAIAGVRERYGDRVGTVSCPYEACVGAEALVLVTEWEEYRMADFERVAAALSRRLVIDGRNLWSRRGLRERGFSYEGIGVRA